MQGELKMLINLRNNAEKLVVKDILDIDFDMSVEEKNNRYIINVNRQYSCAEEYDNEKDSFDVGGSLLYGRCGNGAACSPW